MLYRSQNNRVAFEPGDVIRCENAEDEATLGDIFAKRGIPWEFVYELDGQRGIWLKVLPEEAAEE